MKTHISVIIPAHNEEKYIKRCIDSIKKADSVFPGNTEIIVVCNRCTDNTENIARENGSKTLINEDRCIAKVRNAGIAAAKGRIIVTIDADNRMTKNTLREIYALLRSGEVENISEVVHLSVLRDIHFLYGVMIFCVELHLELRDYIVEYSGRKKEHLMQLEVLWIRGQWRMWPQQSY